MLRRNILLNPGPATTSQSVKDALVVPDICPREAEFGLLLESLCRDLLRVVEAGPDFAAILIGGSGTAAMEAVMSSMPPPGARVLVVENGAYGTRFRQIAERHGIPVIAYRLGYGSYPDAARVGELLDEHRDISHVFVVHHETTTGMLNPVGAIAEAVHGRADLVVDAMSSYGGLAVTPNEWKAAFVIASSNKCLQGMPGLGFVLARRDRLTASYARTYYLDLVEQHRVFEATRQTRFTPPVQVCYALRRALDEFFGEGAALRLERYRTNWEILYAGLRELGFQFLLPREQESGILLAVREPADPSYSFDEMHDTLYAQGYTIYPGKGAARATFRLSVLGDLYAEDIRGFLEALGKYLRARSIDAAARAD